MYSFAIFLPAIVGVLIWIYRFKSEDGLIHNVGGLLGWVFVAWTTLLVPNGLHCFTGVVVLFVLVHIAWPSVAAQLSLPPKPPAPPKPPTPEKMKEETPTDSVLPPLPQRPSCLACSWARERRLAKRPNRIQAGCCRLNRPGIFPAHESR